MNDTPSMGDLFGGEAGGGWLNMPLGNIESPGACDIALLGIGSATPYPAGSYCHDAPDAIRAARSWPTILEQHDFDLCGVEPSEGVLTAGITAADFGNLDVVADSAAEVTARNRQIIRGAMTGLLDAGAVPFVLGGDDSVPIPVLESYCGFAGGPISILQIDAHIDWRDEVGGERGPVQQHAARLGNGACRQDCAAWRARHRLGPQDGCSGGA